MKKMYAFDEIFAFKIDKIESKKTDRHNKKTR